MTTPAGTADPVMARITDAMSMFHHGDGAGARRALLSIWAEITPAGDPLHRCTLAHYLADMFDDAAQSLMWDTRALDAADALTDERAQRHHAGLSVTGFYPSLHLNLADNLRRLGSFTAATEHIAAARGSSETLGDDAYGNLIRTALDEVETAIERGDTARRAGN
ncbi:hypothetical protein OG921_14630 [Aldersonia sp. NBC_00410]|uniref:hypothetical protein n=1 Tax=Aldersonia sp. NBC_00410 TaxID=2975954 RepID=UPI002258E5F9|nr:hypothetical protein [Aldersonia sp. NBC_00410]MCX5044403.1 hypothetical protein [Aldersonia sp. NBC_00410]